MSSHLHNSASIEGQAQPAETVAGQLRAATELLERISRNRALLAELSI
jgi:hypothetical protein